MDFDPSRRSRDFAERLTEFMQDRVYPAEPTFEDQLHQLGDPHGDPPVMAELKEEARRRGLWNLFHPDPAYGPGLSCVEYAPLAEITGRSYLGPEATNCAAPDTGNMEVVSLFGTPEQKEQWLRPLLEGQIRSAFAMTEPDVASSEDPTAEATWLLTFRDLEGAGGGAMAQQPAGRFHLEATGPAGASSHAIKEQRTVVGLRHPASGLAHANTGASREPE